MPILDLAKANISLRRLEESPQLLGDRHYLNLILQKNRRLNRRDHIASKGWIVRILALAA